MPLLYIRGEIYYMLESIDNRNLAFKELSQEEKDKRGILGRLYGPCADIAHGTRNGRKYSESLWEKVFDRPLVKEMIEAGGIPGELDHPVDRQETDSSRIAIMMPEAPKKDKDGHLMAYFDIIDTPCGKIAYALAKYGFKLGVSSRGSGDTYLDNHGEEVVDEDTYDFNCFDIVLCPSVKDARQDLVVESLDKTNRKGLTEALNNVINLSNEDDKKVMLEALKDLNIDYSPEKGNNTLTEGNEEVGNAESEMLKQLKESILTQRELEKQVSVLQEKLSVCYAKDNKNEELDSRNKALQRRVEELERRCGGMKSRIESLTESNKSNATKNESLTKSIENFKKIQQNGIEQKKSLSEKLASKDSEIEILRERCKELKESVDKHEADSKKELSKLQESVADIKKDYAIKESQLNEKLSNREQLAEKYKNIAKHAVDKYIEKCAITLGVDKARITEKLGKGYSFDDIDRICESLQNYVITENRLPFDTTKKVRMKMTESKEPIIPKSKFDDNVDDSLMNMVKTLL